LINSPQLSAISYLARNPVFWLLYCNKCCVLCKEWQVLQGAGWSYCQHACKRQEGSCAWHWHWHWSVGNDGGTSWCWFCHCLWGLLYSLYPSVCVFLGHWGCCYDTGNSSVVSNNWWNHLETSLPPYLSQHLLPYAPTRGLCSFSSKLLQVPRTNLRFGSHSFCVSAPTIWNSVPHSVRSWKSLTTFRKHLKTLYFQLAFSHFSDTLSISYSTSWFWRFINLLTYLLYECPCVFVCVTCVCITVSVYVCLGFSASSWVCQASDKRQWTWWSY